jgi:hypothetical protein
VYVLAYAVLAFVPGALFLAAAKAFDWWTRAGSRPRLAHATDRPPIERLVGDLKRLERDYSRIQGSDLPRQALRLQSVSLAYDDALCACCAALEIPTAGRPPLNAMQRLEIEAALARHGLTW